MTAPEFAAAGEYLFGDSWQSQLARLLDVNLRTVQRWAAGQNPVPDHAARDVAALVAMKQRRQSATLPRS